MKIKDAIVPYVRRMFAVCVSPEKYDGQTFLATKVWNCYNLLQNSS